MFFLVLIKISINYRTDVLQFFSSERILKSWCFLEQAHVHTYWQKYCAGTIDCPEAMLPCL
jgi:hypothetical protein